MTNENSRMTASIGGEIAGPATKDSGDPRNSPIPGKIQQDGRPRDAHGNYIDRRKPSFKSFIYGAFNPRRRRVSRHDDADRTFLDWHPRHLLIVCSTILTLSVLDGLLTVHLVNIGVRQFNPILSSLFSANVALYALVKVAFTAVGITGLVLTAHMRIYNLVKASTILYGFLLIYAWLVVYQAYLAQAIHRL